MWKKLGIMLSCVRLTKAKNEIMYVVALALVCILQTVSGIGGGSFNGINGKERRSSTSSMVRLYAAGSTFGEIGQSSSWELGWTAVVSLKQNKCRIRVLGKFKASSSAISC